MTLDEAIEQLRRGRILNRSTANTRLREALGLGIEALKRIEHGRLLHNRHCQRTLPGETK